MKVLLNEQGFYTGSFVKVGNITGGIEVYSLPEEYSLDKQKFCKPENSIEEVINKIPIFGIVKEIDKDTRKFITYIEKTVENEETVKDEVVDGTKSSETSEENTLGEPITKTVYVPAIIDENGEYIVIPEENIIFVAIDPATNEIVEDVEVTSAMSMPIIRYDEVVEHKNITIWTFDEEAYNNYIKDLEENPPIIEPSESERIANLEEENIALNEQVTMLNETLTVMLEEILPGLMSE